MLIQLSARGELYRKQHVEVTLPTAQRKVSTASKVETNRKPRTDPQRLKAFAARLNMMLAELGLPERGRARAIKEEVGVSGTTAANWLRGDSYPSFEELGRIGRLGVDPIRLFTETNETAPEATATSMGSTISKRLARLMESNELLPLIQLQSLPAGRSSGAFPSRIWQKLLGPDLTGFGMIYMKGDAMEPRIDDGTPLIVDTNRKQIDEDNAIYALLLGDAILVRRVQRRLQGGYLVSGDNAAVASETLDRLSPHDSDSAKGRDVLVLGRIALAMQKL